MPSTTPCSPPLMPLPEAHHTSGSARLRHALRHWLREHGFTVAELARRVGERQPRVHNFLAGRAALSVLVSYQSIERLTGGEIKAADLAAEAPPSAQKGLHPLPPDEALVPGVRRCKDCGEAKPITEFREQRFRCDSCIVARRKAAEGPPATHKLCGRCENVKPLSDFSKTLQGRPSLHCTECMEDLRRTAKERSSERQRAYYKANTAKMRERNKRNRKADPGKDRRRRYRISEEDYQRMVAVQGGRCAACGEAAELFVDHCHSTGIVRGLLCHTCNVGLGQLKDRDDRLVAAIAYIEGGPEAVREMRRNALAIGIWGQQGNAGRAQSELQGVREGVREAVASRESREGEGDRPSLVGEAQGRPSGAEAEKRVQEAEDGGPGVPEANPPAKAEAAYASVQDGPGVPGEMQGEEECTLCPDAA
jgi:hypothetical protein